MNKKEEIENRRFFEWHENIHTRSCKNCNWSGYEKGSIMITCGTHYENFTPTSSCGSWTSPNDKDLLEYQDRKKRELKAKFKKYKLT